MTTGDAPILPVKLTESYLSELLYYGEQFFSRQENTIIHQVFFA
jgi:hypothetical protein